MKTTMTLLAFLCVGLAVLATEATYAAPSAQTPPAEAISPDTVHLAVIGAGSLGGTVGSAWVRAGYTVMLSSRHPDELRPMAERLGDNALVGTPEEAARFGDIVLLAVPYDAIPQVSRDFNGLLRGKILLDATNSWGAESSPIGQEAAREGDGVVNQRYFQGTRLVRAFSAVDATVIRASFERSRNNKAGVPLASDDPEAMQIAAALVEAAGCVPVMVGDLQAGRGFEHGHPGFRANTTAPRLREILGLPASPSPSSRGRPRTEGRSAAWTESRSFPRRDGDVAVSDGHTDALDLVGYQEQSGGLDQVATVLSELAERLRADRMPAAADAAPVAWAQRLMQDRATPSHGVDVARRRTPYAFQDWDTGGGHRAPTGPVVMEDRAKGWAKSNYVHFGR
jgi:predicted dinucleotide-binding enzyme